MINDSIRLRILNTVAGPSSAHLMATSRGDPPVELLEAGILDQLSFVKDVVIVDFLPRTPNSANDHHDHISYL